MGQGFEVGQSNSAVLCSTSATIAQRKLGVKRPDHCFSGGAASGQPRLNNLF